MYFNFSATKEKDWVRLIFRGKMEGKVRLPHGNKASTDHHVEWITRILPHDERFVKNNIVIIIGSLYNKM